MFRGRGISISREGWYYLFVALFIIGGAVLREVNLLVLLAGMMVGPLMFSWRLVSLATRKLTLSRAAPRRVNAGDPLTVRITARSGHRQLGCWGVGVRDRLCREGAPRREKPAEVEVLIPALPAGGTRTVTYRARLTRRGRYRFDQLVASTRFPFGLVKAWQKYAAPGEVIVCPRLGRLTSEWQRALDSQRVGERRRSRQGLVEGDFYGLREWQSGDSLRWVHWRTTAKIGALAVRLFEQQRHRELALVLDLWQPAAPEDAHRERVELAISFAATAIVEQTRQGGGRAALAVAGRQMQRWSGPASGVFAQEVLEGLALVQAGSGELLAEAVAAATERLRSDTQLVVLSTRDQRHGGAAVEPLRGAVLWVNVSDPGVQRYYRLD